MNHFWYRNEIVTGENYYIKHSLSTYNMCYRHPNKMWKRKIFEHYGFRGVTVVNYHILLKTRVPVVIFLRGHNMQTNITHDTSLMKKTAFARIKTSVFNRILLKAWTFTCIVNKDCMA